MLVKNRMTTNLLTVNEDLPVLEATELMHKNNVRRLPVVKGEKLIGIVTEDDLLRVSPSSATSLSVFEMNYLLSKLLIRDVMTKPVITIDPEATLEEAALIMREKNIGALPVVKDGKLVGIITESNIFDAFIDLMGLKETGTRVTIVTEDRIGVIAEVTDIIRSFGINLVSIAALHTEGTQYEVILRLDTKQPQAVLDAIEKRGYKVAHVASLPG
ncbi:MAG TPA: CBS and ACT domain-containing protein [Bacillota bacterium]